MRNDDRPELEEYCSSLDSALPRFTQEGQRDAKELVDRPPTDEY